MHSAKNLKSRSQERFLILTRSLDCVSSRLVRLLSQFGEVEVIVDTPASKNDQVNAVWIPDEEAEGFEHLMSSPKNFPAITAWSRAFVHLARTIQKGDGVWFVEDDVAGDAESFRQLIEGTVKVGADLSASEFEPAAKNPDWVWFPTAEGFFSKPWRSFNPLCRLSSDLLGQIFSFKKHHGRMTFHEVLFASIADECEMTILNWQENADFKFLVANFKYRPIIEGPVQGVCHPVKELELVNLFCEAPPPEFPRMGLAELSGYSILSEDYIFLSRFCRRMGFRSVVEFGPGDSTLAFRDAACEVVSYEHDREWLEKSRKLFEGDSKIVLRFCDRSEVPEGEQQVNAVDLVFVDGPPQIEEDEMSRLKVCEWAMATYGAFLIHDAKRHSEGAILQVFLERGCEVLEIPTRKGMALVFDKHRHSGFGECGLDGIGDWPYGEWLAWKVFIGNSALPNKVLALGGEGKDQLFASVRELFSHPDSLFHRVFRPDPEFNEVGEEVEIYEGEFVEVLSWMIVNDGYWESFDFVLIDQQIPAFDLLACVCQAWSLLKPGGLMGLANVRGDKDADNELIDSLTRLLENKASVMLEGETCIFLKLAV